MSWEYIVNSIVNAHSDVLEIFNKLREFITSDNDVTFELTSGSYTVSSLRKMQHNIMDSLIKNVNIHMGLHTGEIKKVYVHSGVGDDRNDGKDKNTPVKTIKRAVELIDRAGIIFLAKGGNYFSYYQDGANLYDIPIVNKIILFTVYDPNSGNNALTDDSQNFGETDYPSIIAQMVPTMYAWDKFHARILNRFSPYESLSEGGYAKRPYTYSFYVKDSVLIFYKVHIKTTVDYSSDIYNTTNGLINIIPKYIGAFIKDYYLTAGDNRILVYENFTTLKKNLIIFSDVLLSLLAPAGGVFYFNHMLDTSSRYYIIFDGVKIKPAPTDPMWGNSVGNALYKYIARPIVVENIYIAPPDNNNKKYNKLYSQVNNNYQYTVNGRIYRKKKYIINLFLTSLTENYYFYTAGTNNPVLYSLKINSNTNAPLDVDTNSNVYITASPLIYEIRDNFEVTQTQNPTFRYDYTIGESGILSFPVRFFETAILPYGRDINDYNTSIPDNAYWVDSSPYASNDNVLNMSTKLPYKSQEDNTQLSYIPQVILNTNLRLIY